MDLQSHDSAGFRFTSVWWVLRALLSASRSRLHSTFFPEKILWFTKRKERSNCASSFQTHVWSQKELCSSNTQTSSNCINQKKISYKKKLTWKNFVTRKNLCNKKNVCRKFSVPNKKILYRTKKTCTEQKNSIPNKKILYRTKKFCTKKMWTEWKREISLCVCGQPASAGGIKAEHFTPHIISLSSAARSCHGVSPLHFESFQSKGIDCLKKR